MTKRIILAVILIILSFIAILIFVRFEPKKIRRQDSQPVYDIIIKNGLVVDGTGKAGKKVDIGIEKDRITAIEDLQGNAKKEIDASGLVVAPGFINPHSHTDQTIFIYPTAFSALKQGITTEIIGNDGDSAVDLDAHFTAVEKQGSGVNYASLIGQGAVRNAIMGESANRSPNEKEIEAMQQLVIQAMVAGALGLSTGLEYSPGIYSSTQEIIALAQEIAPYNGVYSTHIRNEKEKILDALEEALLIGKEAGCASNISHLKVNTWAGLPVQDTKKKQAELTSEIITRIMEARKNGQKVSADLYPYTVTWFQGKRMLKEVYHQYNPERIYFMDQEKTLAALAEEKKINVTTLARQIITSDPAIDVYVKTLTEDSIRSFLKSDFTMISNDAPALSGNIPPGSYFQPRASSINMLDRVHPRGYGTYARILGKHVREDHDLTLETAIAKMTGQVAEVYHLKNRGFIRPGYYADLVIFDPLKVAEKATYGEPAQYACGFHYVLVNGCLAIEKEQFTGALAGQMIRVNTAEKN